MSGGPKFEYRWADGHKYKKPTALSAPQYITLLMEWVEAQINDETIFPVTVGETLARGPQTVCHMWNFVFGLWNSRYSKGN